MCQQKLLKLKGKKKKILKTYKQITQALWDNYKRCNIGIIGMPEGEERKEKKIYLKQ